MSKTKLFSVGVFLFAIIWGWHYFRGDSPKPENNPKDAYGHDGLWEGCHGVRPTGYYMGRFRYDRADDNWSCFMCSHWVDGYGHWVGEHSRLGIVRCFETAKEAKNWDGTFPMETGETP